MSATITTYSTLKFRETFLQKDQQVEALFKSTYKDFFCIKLEEVIPFARFPVPPAREECHTLIFVTEGYYKAKIGFKSYQFGRGEIGITQAGKIFSIDQLEAPIKGYACHFHEDLLIGKLANRELLDDFNFLKVWSEPFIKISEDRLSNYAFLFHRLYEGFNENNPSDSGLISAYLLALLYELRDEHSAESPGKIDAARELTRRFKVLLAKHFSTHHQTSAYAQMINVSPNHLNKSVKRSTGKSPKSIISDTLLTEAKYLLFQTQFNINQIATQLGFQDISYFSRFFKKKTGMPPLQFRRMIEKS